MGSRCNGTKPPVAATLKGLIYEPGQISREELNEPRYSHPTFYAIVVGVMFIALNIAFF